MNNLNLKVYNMQQYKIENLDNMKAAVAQLANDIERKHHLSEEKFFDFRLVLSELIINAFKHSDRGYFVDVFLDGDYAKDEIKITVQDYGNGFDVNEVIKKSNSHDIYNNCGRGIKLVNALCDEVEYNEIGNRVSIVMKI